MQKEEKENKPSAKNNILMELFKGYSAIEKPAF